MARLYRIRLPGLVRGRLHSASSRAMKPEIGVCFTGPDKLVHLIEAGEVVPGLGRQLILRHGFSSYSAFIPNQVQIRNTNDFSTDPAAPTTCCVSRKRVENSLESHRPVETALTGPLTAAPRPVRGRRPRPESGMMLLGPILGASTGLCRHETAFPAFGVTEPEAFLARWMCVVHLLAQNEEPA